RLITAENTSAWPLMELLRFPKSVHDVSVVGLPGAEPEVGLGKSVECGERTGTLGCRVRTASRGITTAGHVAIRVATAAYVDGDQIGHITATSHLAMHPKGSTCADIAVISLDGVLESLSPGVKSLSNATIGDELVIRTKHGTTSAIVRGVSPS